MRDNLDIEKLFKDKFESFEPSVSTKVWQGVASNISSASAASTAGAIWVKSLLISAAVASVVVGGWLYFSSNEAVPANVVINNKTEQPVLKMQPEVSEKQEADEVLLNHSENTEIPAPQQYNLIENNREEASQVSNKIVKQTDNKKLKSVSKTSEGAQNKTENTLADKQQINTVNSNTENKSNATENVTVSNTPLSQTEKGEDLTEDKSSTSAPIKDDVVEVAFDEKSSEKASFIKEIPNIFTPNNDMRNDQFFIPSENVKNIESFYIVIYSQSNIKLFESENVHFKWDGYDMGGNKVPTGVYYYLIKAKGTDSTTYSIPGQINIR